MLMAEHIFYDFAQAIATLQLLIEISVTQQNFIFWQLLGKRKHMFVVMSGKIKSCFLSKMILKVNMMDCSGKRFEFYMRSSYQKPNVAAIYLCRHANSVHARLTCLRILRLFCCAEMGQKGKRNSFHPPPLLSMLYSPSLPSTPLSFSLSFSLSSFPHCFASYLMTIVWFVVGVRLLHSTRRVSCGLCWFTYLVKLPHVQDVLLSLWRDAGKPPELVSPQILCLTKYLVQVQTPSTENVNLLKSVPRFCT